MLNERFKVVLDAPTLRILSLDDDVLRPRAALDAAFVRWTRKWHPEQMGRFDARTHVVAGDSDNDGNTREGGGNDINQSSWKHWYVSTTESSNRYSMTLTKTLHRSEERLSVKH